MFKLITTSYNNTISFFFIDFNRSPQFRTIIFSSSSSWWCSCFLKIFEIIFITKRTMIGVTKRNDTVRPPIVDITINIMSIVCFVFLLSV